MNALSYVGELLLLSLAPREGGKYTGGGGVEVYGGVISCVLFFFRGCRKKAASVSSRGAYGYSAEKRCIKK